MNEKEYIIATRRTDPDDGYEPGGGITERLRTARMARLLHYAMGVCTEAGELLDAVKKAAIYGRPLDKTNIVEELGDGDWYRARLLDLLGVDPAEVRRVNIEKLRKRYPDGFTEEAAVERDLAGEREVLEGSGTSLDHAPPLPQDRMDAIVRWAHKVGATMTLCPLPEPRRHKVIGDVATVEVYPLADGGWRARRLSNHGGATYDFSTPEAAFEYAVQVATNQAHSITPKPRTLNAGVLSVTEVVPGIGCFLNTGDGLPHTLNPDRELENRWRVWARYGLIDGTPGTKAGTIPASDAASCALDRVEKLGDRGAPNEHTGATEAPPHYAGDREAVDVMRDMMPDVFFAAACETHAAKYRIRAGRKGDAEIDEQKAEWWEAMGRHALGLGEDPRTSRPGWDADRDGYQRQDHPGEPYATEARMADIGRRVVRFIASPGAEEDAEAHATPDGVVEHLEAMDRRSRALDRIKQAIFTEGS